LERHTNNKKKCNLITEFKCDKCNKCFTQKKNLVYHTENNICKEIINTVYKNENKNALLDILNNNISLDDKIFFIKKINVTISNDEIKKIINSKFDISTKITLLSTN